VSVEFLECVYGMICTQLFAHSIQLLVVVVVTALPMMFTVALFLFLFFVFN